MKFSERYNRLNPAQKQACDHVYGPCMVVAGPGSGKTELLSLRIANLLRNTDTLPQNILCLTFTDAATKNLQKRLYKLIGASALNVSIFTFHGFVSNILSSYSHKFDNLKTLNDLKAQQVLYDLMNSQTLSNKLCVKNEGSFIYFSAVFGYINDFKKSALKPNELRTYIDQLKISYESLNNLFNNIFKDRLSKKKIDLIYNQVSNFNFLPDDYSQFIKAELLIALRSAIELEATKPLSKFKAEYLTKDQGDLVLKSYLSIEKVESLIALYNDFQENIKEQNLASFNDLILDFLDLLRTDPDFLMEVSEKFNFIMVDEFQDTNLAQMKILKLLLSNSNDDPNLMVVGDDDQAIYKFQGASISNILEFKNLFSNVKTVVLNTKYRSTSQVVDYSQRLVNSLEKRVTSIFEDVNKNLDAFFKEKKGHVSYFTTTTFDAECKYLQNNIQDLLQNKHDPSEIAIIARNNRDLKKLSEYFSKVNIPYELSLSKNIFQIEFVEVLVKFVELIVLYNKGDRNFEPIFLDFILNNANDLERLKIWELGYKVRKSKGKLENVFLESDDLELKGFIIAFIELASKFKNTPFLRVFYKYLDSTNNMFFETVFRKHFLDFSSNLVLENFQALKLLDSNLNEYFNNQNYTVSDLLVFLNLVNDLNYNMKLPVLFQKHEKKVNLITAHSSKGLEFETVFIMDCNEEKWNKGNISRIRLPETWNFVREKENREDFIRLFFVAMTRAKNNLIFTRHLLKDSGREKNELSFMSPLRLSEKHIDTEVSIEDNVEAFELEIFEDFILNKKESDYFHGLFKNWRLSATAVTDFINIVDFNYQEFIQRHILKVPSQTNKFLIFGSLVHGVIEDLFSVKYDFNIYDEKIIVEFLETRLLKLPVFKEEKEDMIKKALMLFPRLFQFFANQNYKNPLVESFLSPKLPVDDNFINLIGAIDLLDIDKNSNTLKIVDFKTGKAIEDLDTLKGNENKKLKAFRYKIQLHFYVLLINLWYGKSFASLQKSASLIFIEAKNIDLMEVKLDFDPQFYEMLKNVIVNIHKIVSNNQSIDTSKYDQNFNGIQDFFIDLSSSDFKF